LITVIIEISKNTEVMIMTKKTEKLYYTDAYLSEFDALVLSCEKSDKGCFETVLDKTAFFPEEGGQYADTGVLDSCRVLDVRERDGVIIHITDKPLEAGNQVHGKIDFQNRFEKMQCHSGEHIVSGLISKLHGLNNVGFHLGHDDVTLDFDGVLTREELDNIERIANSIVYKNIEIKAEFPSADELKVLEYRSKLELFENVRIVTIDGVDVCACCAPHVSRTGEIGIIKLLDFIHYKGGIRIHMLCGYRALADYSERYNRNREISNMLSVKQLDVCPGVKRLFDECTKLKSEMSALRRTCLKERMNSLKESSAPIIIFDSILAAGEARELANAAADKTESFAAVFCEKGDGSYTYIITAKADTKPTPREISAILNESFSARGGGTDTMISGSIMAAREDIERTLNL